MVSCFQFLSFLMFVLCGFFFSYHKKNADCISAKFFSSLLLITHSSPSALSSTVLFRSRSSRSSVAVIIVWTLYKFDGHSFTRFKNFLKMKQTPKISAKIISYDDVSISKRYVNDTSTCTRFELGNKPNCHCSNFCVSRQSLIIYFQFLLNLISTVTIFNF